MTLKYQQYQYNNNNNNDGNQNNYKMQLIKLNTSPIIMRKLLN